MATKQELKNRVNAIKDIQGVDILVDPEIDISNPKKYLYDYIDANSEVDGEAEVFRWENASLFLSNKPKGDTRSETVSMNNRVNKLGERLEEKSLLNIKIDEHLKDVLRLRKQESSVYKVIKETIVVKQSVYEKEKVFIETEKPLVVDNDKPLKIESKDQLIVKRDNNVVIKNENPLPQKQLTIDDILASKEFISAIVLSLSKIFETKSQTENNFLKLMKIKEDLEAVKTSANIAMVNAGKIKEAIEEVSDTLDTDSASVTNLSNQYREKVNNIINS